jgi:hypothetical protein
LLIIIIKRDNGYKLIYQFLTSIHRCRGKKDLLLKNI